MHMQNVNLAPRTNVNQDPNSSKTTKLNPKKQGLQILFGPDWQKWNYLQNQLSYVTPCHISAKVSQLAFHYYGRTSKVRALWDMFGGLGMDAINLSKYFQNIVVTEIDPKVFASLLLNIQNLTLPGADLEPTDPSKDPSKADKTSKEAKDAKEAKEIESSIQAFNQDAILKMKEKHFLKGIDLIYFDPPWGNSFKTGEPFDFEKATISTIMSGKHVEQNILDLLDKIYDKVPNIVVKSPILSDSFEKWAARKKANVLQICEFPTHKLKYIYLGPKIT